MLVSFLLRTYSNNKHVFGCFALKKTVEFELLNKVHKYIFR